MKASIVGAILGIVSNIALVPGYGAYGTCLVLIISELGVTLTYIFITRKENVFFFPIKLLMKYILIGIPYLIILSILNHLLNNVYLVMAVSMILFFTYFLLTESKYNKTGVICNIISKLKLFR